MNKYHDIKPSGGDTGASFNLRKRLCLMQKHMTLHGKKIIDCGCGTGQYVLALNELGAETCGIEYSVDKVKKFRFGNPQLIGLVTEGNVEKMFFGDGTFDIALLNEVLEHVADEVRALSEVNRILKSCGYLIIFSPNRLYPLETHGVSFLRSGIELSHYLPFIPYIPLRVGNWLFRYNARNYWPWELRRLIRQSGFTIVHTDYIWQTFENISGKQPRFVAMLRPLLRHISTRCERLPLIKVFGVSQVIIAKKS